MATVRDRLWMFGVRPHQDDVWFNQPRKDRLYSRSRITPAEGAFMLDIPNMLMINCDGEPAPFSHDAYGYAESFIRMERVLWGATGSDGAPATRSGLSASWRSAIPTYAALIWTIFC